MPWWVPSWEPFWRGGGGSKGDWEFILGGALLVAGLASLVGDAIYTGGNYRMIPPAEREHNRISLGTSGALVLIGNGLLVKSYL